MYNIVDICRLGFIFFIYSLFDFHDLNIVSYEINDLNLF